MTDARVIDDAALLAQLEPAVSPTACHECSDDAPFAERRHAEGCSFRAPAPVNLGDDGRWGEATPEADDVATEAPRNATTGEPYKGGNVPRLLSAALANGYRGPEWAGFKQWLTAGRVVRKGERGTACRTVIQTTDKKGRPSTTCRGFVVFHRDQTTELEGTEQ